MPNFSTDAIPYEEYRAINELRRLHPQTHEGRLRALVVFGDLVASGQTFDINLLEVIEQWQGPRHVSFRSTPELPLRGQLRLYFLTPSEFERPSEQNLTGERWSSASLLTQVCKAYAILLEDPNNYATDVLSRLDTDTPPVIGTSQRAGDEEGPASFFRRAVNADR